MVSFVQAIIPYHPSWRCLQVVRRHVLVWQKSWIASLMGSFGEPLFFMLGMGYGLGSMVGQVGGIPYLWYVASGILAANSMHTATFESLYGAFTRMTRQNTFHAMLATPLNIADIVAGEIIWSALRTLIAGMAIFLVAKGLGAFPGEWAFLTLPIVFLSGLVFASVAMMVTACSPSYEFFMYYFTLVTTPMALFSGVYFPISVLPEVWIGVVELLPLSHVVAIIRPLAIGGPIDDLGYHLLHLLVVGGGAYCLAVRWVARRIIV